MIGEEHGFQNWCVCLLDFQVSPPKRFSSKRCRRAAQILRISEKGEISVETQGFEGFLHGGNLFSGGVCLVSQKSHGHLPPQVQWEVLPNLRSHRSRFGQYDRSTQEVLQLETQILRATKGAPCGDQFLQNSDLGSGLGAKIGAKKLVWPVWWCLKIFLDTIFSAQEIPLFAGPKVSRKLLFICRPGWHLEVNFLEALQVSRRWLKLWCQGVCQAPNRMLYVGNLMAGGFCLRGLIFKNLLVISSSPFLVS